MAKETRHTPTPRETPRPTPKPTERRDAPKPFRDDRPKPQAEPPRPKREGGGSDYGNRP